MPQGAVGDKDGGWILSVAGGLGRDYEPHGTLGGRWPLPSDIFTTKSAKKKEDDFGAHYTETGDMGWPNACRRKPFLEPRMDTNFHE